MGRARAAEIVRFADGASAWEVATRRPAGRLAAHLDRYVGYRERAAAPSSRREVSGARLVVVLELGPPILVRGPHDAGRRHAGGFVAGVGDRFSITEHDGVQEGVELSLDPIGARLLFGVPLDELAGRVVALGDVLGADRDLAERVGAEASWDGRFDVLDRVLTRRLAEPSLPTRVTAWALASIHAARGAIDVRALAADAGYSDKHLTRLFHDHVGVGPKRWARLVRLDHMLAAATRAPDRSWAELATAHGYADQSHLARDVRDLTGLTPSELRADRLGAPEPLREA